ncbi:MAG: hypothetical protein MJE77_17510 [Proteobacteria bacterium]|nr:hypothetical protein [Pseudomonadota bacterium]
MRWIALTAVGSGAAMGLAWIRYAMATSTASDALERAVASDEQAVQATGAALSERCSRPRGQLGKRLTRSTCDKHDTVIQSPAELLAQARKLASDITLEELTAARLAASEHFPGSLCELEAIIDAEVNRARSQGKSLTEHLTSRGTYGRQGGRANGGQRRKASTKRDPHERHLRAARAIVTTGQSRGIACGAVVFFDPVAQLKANRRWLRGESQRRHCHPLVILERWAFARPWSKSTSAGKSSCKLNRDRSGSGRLEWVGPIPGIDPLRLLLMRPATAKHAQHYKTSRDLLRRYLSEEPL